MDKFENYISKHENYNTLMSVFNLVCEITEGEKMSPKDKFVYASQMFHVVAKELHRKGKISDDLWKQCEHLDEEQVKTHIDQVIELWNKAVPILKRIRKSLRKLKCC